MNRPLAVTSCLVVIVVLAAAGWESHPATVGEPAVGERVGERVGPLVIIGGGLSSTNEDVYRAILDGRSGHGPLCVIPTASGAPSGSMEAAVARIDEWGGDGSALGIYLPYDEPGRAWSAAVADTIRGCSGFFFTGGDQSRILDVFLPDEVPTPTYDALMERHRSGAVIAGSSAGAAMVSDPMIAGGSSRDAFRLGAVGPRARNAGVDSVGEGAAGDEAAPAGVHIRPGMGFIEGTIIDQHFLARGRIGRLIVAVMEHDDVAVGWGIDENTALIIEGGKARVAGASGVVMVDGTQAVRLPGSPAAVEGLRLQLLGAGDRVDLDSRQVIPAAGKDDVVPTTPRAEQPAGDLFDRWVFLHLLEYVARARPHELVVEAEGHELRFRPAPGFRGVSYPELGVEATAHGLSVGPLIVTIRSRDRDAHGNH